jgi:ATP-dependent Clp protease protease subunit
LYELTILYGYKIKVQGINTYVIFDFSLNFSILNCIYIISQEIIFMYIKEKIMKKIDWDVLLGEETKEVSKMNLPDPDLLDFYRRTYNREIYINTDIDEMLIDFSLKIIEWNREDKGIEDISKRKIIKVFINSDGGCVNSVMNFINVIKLSKTPVWTIAMGKAFSSGGLLLMAGHKRFIFENTEVLVHDGSTGAYGDTGKVLDSLERTKGLEERVKKYILTNTKITEKLYDKNYRRDWWLFSDKIIELSIADSIVTDLSEIY